MLTSLFLARVRAILLPTCVLLSGSGLSGESAAVAPVGFAHWVSPMENENVQMAIGVDRKIYVKSYSGTAWIDWGLSNTGLPAGPVRQLTARGGPSASERYYFAIAADGVVYIRAGAPGSFTNWIPWATGLPLGTTKLVTPMDNTYDVNAIASDGQVYRRYFNGSFWTSWELSNSGLPAGTALQVTNRGNMPAAWGRYNLAIGSDGRVYLRASTTLTWGNWSLWDTGLPSGKTRFVTPMAASANGVYDLIAIGSDGRIYRRYYDGTRAGSVWSNWQLFSTGLPAGTVVQVTPRGGRTDNSRALLAIAANGRVYLNSSNDGVTWSNWTLWDSGLPAGTTNQVAATDANYRFMAIGSDKKAYIRYLAGTTWTNWLPWSNGLAQTSYVFNIADFGPPPEDMLVTRRHLVAWMEDTACDFGYQTDFFCRDRLVAGNQAAGALAGKSSDQGEPSVLSHSGAVSGSLFDFTKLGMRPPPGPPPPALCQRSGLAPHGNNGCSIPKYFGTGFLTSLTSDEFYDACSNHDECFQHGYESEFPGGKSAAACNIDLLSDMRRICDVNYPANPGRALCYDRAGIVYMVVDSEGTEFYHTTPKSGVDGQLGCSPKIQSAAKNAAGMMVVTHAPVDTNNCSLDSLGCSPTQEPDCWALNFATGNNHGFSLGTQLCGSPNNGSVLGNPSVCGRYMSNPPPGLSRGPWQYLQLPTGSGMPGQATCLWPGWRPL